MSDNTPQAPSPEQLAELLPQYAIDSFIAQGGMGAVYRGRQVSLDRDVAIKVLLYEFGEDTNFLESFTTEAKAMARLSHSNLLGVFDYGKVDGMPYIVMEYGEGGSLHEAAWNKVIDPIQASNIITGICAGLAHAHEHGIVHRDIKPANILLTVKAETKVGDFGLAHSSDSDQTGLVMGTPGYTAPEVFNDPDQAGELADIYSVGVILHQLLTGIDPAGIVEPPTEPTGNLHLDAIWRKATHITPAQRYASIAEMGSALEKWSTAKQKILVTADNEPFKASKPAIQPTVLPVQVKTGGMGGKLALIGTLVAAIVLVYHLASGKEKKANEAIANVNEIKNVVTPVPILEVKPRPTSTPKPPVSAPKPADQVTSSPPPVPKPFDKVASNPTPTPKPLDPVGSSPMASPKIVDVDPRNEPVIPPVVVSEPEPEPEPKPTVDLLPGDPKLRERAIGYIQTARKDRDKELVKNARALLSQLSGHTRKVKKDEVKFIEGLKEDVISNRVPLTDDVIGLPEELVKDFERARSKEAVIDKACLSRLTVIRTAYVSRLEKVAGETSDAQLKQRLLAQAVRAKDMEAWLELLAPEPKWVPKKSSGTFGSGDFAGKWDSHAYNNVSRQIAHPNGRMEIVGKKWEVTWEILKDGSLEVVWGKREKVFTYTRDGKGWTGKNNKNVKATMTRGDW